MDVREVIYKHTLKNALEFGKAKEKAILGKVLAELPEYRKRVKEIIPIINEVVKEVNSYPRERIEEEIKKYKFIKVERKKEALPDLKVKDKVVLRFAPNPSGPLHLGHSRAAILNDEYAKRYKGKLILRLEDTDPSRVYPPAYEMIKEDLEWLEVKIHETHIQSERLEIYYNYAEKLISKGKAYVCTCSQEEFKKLRDAKKQCKCRGLSTEENLERFEKMFSEYKEGQAVVRIKTDLALPDPSMRDFPIMRICETPHPKVGEKRVYPLYNFAVTIDDYLMKVTHVLRGKDHIANTRKQSIIYDYFSWQKPEFIHYGRLSIGGVTLSTSKIMEGIKSKSYTGWDDIRLGTLRALAKRGIQAKAIRKAMLEVGVKESDIDFSWENLYAYNKDIIEPIANRYFFVWEPKKLVIKNAPSFEAQPLLHPNFPERGRRKIKIEAKEGKAEVFISSTDAESIKEGEFLRLMEAFNIIILKKSNEIFAEYHSQTLEEARKRKAKLIHWLSGESLPVKVITHEKIFKGLGEENLKNLKEGDIIQFERFGFVRIDKINKEIVAYFTHK